ncbi:hypothetical protein KUCAC02_030990, partial [Chaenocephalus aceratus]
ESDCHQSLHHSQRLSCQRHKLSSALAEVEDEMPHMEDEVEYYSHYDTLMEETAVTLMDKEQSSPITQENSGFGGEPHTEGTAGRDFHMEDQCLSE